MREETGKLNYKGKRIQLMKSRLEVKMSSGRIQSNNLSWAENEAPGVSAGCGGQAAHPPCPSEIPSTKPSRPPLKAATQGRREGIKVFRGCKPEMAGRGGGGRRGVGQPTNNSFSRLSKPSRGDSGNTNVEARLQSQEISSSLITPSIQLMPSLYGASSGI